MVLKIFSTTHPAKWENYSQKGGHVREKKERKKSDEAVDLEEKNGRTRVDFAFKEKIIKNYLLKSNHFSLLREFSFSSSIFL